MILQFPDLDTLRLALATSAVPTRVADAPVRFTLTPSPILETAESISADVQAGLRALGVRGRRSVEGLDQVCGTWFEVLPLESRSFSSYQQPEVLFASREAAPVRQLALEILRLGNTRQKAVTVVPGDGRELHLLHVFQPPAYSLLRALDHPAVELLTPRSPHVWIDVGWEHPFEKTIGRNAGFELLIQPGRKWLPIPQDAFQRVVDSIETDRIPSQALVETHPAEPIRVEMEFVESIRPPDASLWLVTPETRPVWEEFIRRSSTPVLAQLMFAAGERDQEAVIAVRLRPGMIEPPAMPAEFAEFAPYPGLRHVFLPVGLQLFPPLDPDYLQQVVSADPEQLTWIEGDTQHRKPRAFHIGWDAFRPAARWVDYVLSESQVVLKEWIDATLFDLTGIELLEEAEASRRDSLAPVDDLNAESARIEPPPPDESSRNDGLDTQSTSATTQPHFETETRPPVEQTSRPPHDGRERSGDDPGSGFVEPNWNAAVSNLTRLSDQASREARECWSEISRSLQTQRDWKAAAIAQTNVIWIDDSDRQLAWQWFEIARSDDPQSASARPSVSKWLESAWSSECDVNAVAAALWLAGLDDSPAIPPRTLRDIRTWLRAHEYRLSVRGCWLAWLGLTRVSGGDILELARARDRLLKRLQNQGIQPGRDLPAAVLRQAGQQCGADHESLIEATGERFLEWSRMHRDERDQTTELVLKHIFRYALALIHSRSIRFDVPRETRAGANPAADWIVTAYEERAAEAARTGEPAHQQQPEALLAALAELSRMDRYKVDRLRQYSTLLAPDQVVDPFRQWQRGHRDELGQKLKQAGQVDDVNRFCSQIDRLLREFGQSPEARLRILVAGFEQSAMLPAGWTNDRLDESLQESFAACELVTRLQLLRLQLTAASTTGTRTKARLIIERVLDELGAADGSDTKIRSAMLPVIRQASRTCSQLDLRDELTRLQHCVLNWNESTQEVISTPDSEFDSRRDEAALVQLEWNLETRTLWRRPPAELQGDTALKEAARILCESQLSPTLKTRLACSYLSALRSVPLNEIQSALERLFSGDGLKLSDRLTTSADFQIAHIRIAEGLAMLLTDSRLALSPEIQHWLDREEQTVVDRIHADFEQAFSGSTGHDHGAGQK